MPSQRPTYTLADYIVLGITPTLVMGLVGSLVFFLLEVLYAGQYQGRMQWILFFFVFGSVLIARVSMQGDGGSRAGLYGLVLSFLVWIGLQMFVEYPADTRPISWMVNLFLVALVWWCAHRLTWDCTHLDEDAEPDGQGLLQAAGLEHAKSDPEATGTASHENQVEGKPTGPPGWWERYQRYREERKRKRTPGVWVVYFSLAALPLFGLGQALIPATEQGRRQYTFWLLVLYVGCGLGLLLTTCFLGLRRYLRQRRLQMPPALAGVWLTVGGLLIVSLLVIGALLPRPEAEYSVFRSLGGRIFGSNKRDASNFALDDREPGQGEGRPGRGGTAGQKDNASGKGSQPGQQKDQHQGPGKDTRDGRQGKDSRGKGQGQKDAGERGKHSSGQRDSQAGKRSGRPGQDDNKDGKRENAGQKDGNREQRNGQHRSGNEGQRGAGDPKRQDQAGSREGGTSNSTNRSRSVRQALSSLTRLLRTLAPILKWIVFTLLALVVLFVVLRALLQFLANFTNWARNLLESLRNFWRNLLAAWQRKEEEDDPKEDPEKDLERPFSSFQDPFLTGQAEEWTDEQLVRYTFAALQAWARERQLTRSPDETPLEFSQRLGQEVPPLEEPLRQVTLLYLRTAYAGGRLPPQTKDILRTFWDQLFRVTEQPLSA